MFSPTVRHRCWKVRGGAGEVDAGQVGVGQRDLGHRLPVPGDQVDHPGRQPGRLEQAHQVVRRKLLGRRRLPHHHVAEQRGRGRQVARDRGEVERRDGQHEALERAVLHPVPGTGRRLRLLAEHLSGEVDVVAPEVDQLAGRVDLRLERRLGLPQHGGGVHGGAPRPGEQFRRLEEDRGPVVEVERPPAGRRLLGRVDRGGHVHVRRVAQLAEHAVACCAAGPRRSSRPRPSAGWPPMVMVSSARWPASSLILLSSTARSWLPGWYCLTGSLTGTGVLETASITIAPGVRRVLWIPVSSHASRAR